MVKVACGRVINPHKRDNADHREGKQTDENQSCHVPILGNGIAVVKNLSQAPLTRYYSTGCTVH